MYLIRIKIASLIIFMGTLYCHGITLLQKPHILEKGYLDGDVHLCIKDLLFKITDGRKSPKCELWLDGKRISEADEHYSVEYKIYENVFELSIFHFESKLKGTYECVVTTAEEPKVSTAIEVIIDSDSSKLAYRHVMHACTIVFFVCVCVCVCDCVLPYLIILLVL